MTVGIRRDAAVWVLAYTIAVLGDVAYYLVLTWAAAVSGGAAWSGLILAAGELPRLVLLLAGGVLADRIGHRPVRPGAGLGGCLRRYGAGRVQHRRIGFERG